MTQEEPVRLNERCGVPQFNLVMEFLKELKQKDLGVQAKQVCSLHEFEQNSGENLHMQHMRG